MSVLKLSKAPIGLTAALALGGALALSMSCASTASSDNSGGSSGNEGGSSGGSGGDSGGSSGGAGGSSSSFSCTESDTTVCFYQGAAKGPMTGWGWVSLGIEDKLTDPTCDKEKREIHNKDDSGPCKTTTNWNSDTALCISGKIPKLPQDPFPSDYDNNWGIQIGVNTSEPPGTTLGKDYTAVTLTFSGEPMTKNRAELHVKGDAAGVTYCAEATSGQEIKLSSFNKACWDGTNTVREKDLKPEMIPNIDKVGIQVSSNNLEDIEVKNLCLQSIQFKL